MVKKKIEEKGAKKEGKWGNIERRGENEKKRRKRERIPEAKRIHPMPIYRKESSQDIQYMALATRHTLSV